MPSLSVLVVCTGNLCRSQLAERLIQKQCIEQGVDAHIFSAGTKARNGMDIHPTTRELVEEAGAPAHVAQSQLLTPELITNSSLVVTATSQHADRVLDLAPLKWKSTFTLNEIRFIYQEDPHATIKHLHRLRSRVASYREQFDIVDPIGQERSVFEETAVELGQAAIAVTEILKNTVSNVA